MIAGVSPGEIADILITHCDPAILTISSALSTRNGTRLSPSRNLDVP